MDNQQHHQPHDVNGKDVRPETPPVLALQDGQRRIIQALLHQAAGKVLAIQFNEPADDGLRIRQHSYCYGAMDTFNEILMFDQKNMEEFEASYRAKMAPPEVEQPGASISDF